jgi:uncharacterized SAM-binding protein YcdF (DUF218 family)
MSFEYLLRALLRDLVLPPCGPLLLIFAGWLLRGRARRTAQALFWVGALSLWWLSTPLLADRLAAIVQRHPALDVSRPTGAGAVVILSSGARFAAPEYGADAPDEETLLRLSYGAYVARRTGLPILVSGGGFDANAPLATIMRRSLEQDFRMPVQWVETASRDTHENALDSAALLRSAHVQRVILVTGANHMARATAEFRSAGMDVVPAPVGTTTADGHGLLRWVPGVPALVRSQQALYELLGELVRRLGQAARSERTAP